VRSGREYVAGEVPQPLRAFVDDANFNPTLRNSASCDPGRNFATAQNDREGLLAQLMFAARDLAQANLVHFGPKDGGSHCCECHMGELHGCIAHTDKCLTGRVLDILDDLVETSNGIRPRELALQAIDCLLGRIASDPKLAYYFDPISRSMELLTAARAALCGQNVEEFRKSYYPRLTFQSPTCSKCGKGGAR
jgi:hypothetical protein